MCLYCYRCKSLLLNVWHFPYQSTALAMWTSLKYSTQYTSLLTYYKCCLFRKIFFSVPKGMTFFFSDRFCFLVFVCLFVLSCSSPLVSDKSVGLLALHSITTITLIFRNLSYFNSSIVVSKLYWMLVMLWQLSSL